MNGSIQTYGLQLAGVVTFIIGIGHTAFHHVFGWKRDLEKISPLNAKILMTIHIATTLLLLGIGVHTFRYAALLSQPTGISSAICFSLFIFWCWRLVWQIVYFRPSKIEHDNLLLLIHYVLILLFTVLVITYGGPVVVRVWE